MYSHFCQFLQNKSPNFLNFFSLYSKHCSIKEFMVCNTVTKRFLHFLAHPKILMKYFPMWYAKFTKTTLLDMFGIQ